MSVAHLRRSLCLIALLVGALALGACGDDDDDGDGSGGGGGGTDKVTYALGFAANYVQGYFFAALDNGYYKDAGLDVKFVIPDSTQTAAKLVGIGRADAGEFVGTDPVAAVAKDIPLKVAISWSRGELGLMALPDGPIRQLADLEGEKVGVFGSLVYDEVCRPKYLEANGVDPESIETIDIGFSSLPPLLNRRVAASEGGKPFETVSAQLELGEEVPFFSYSEVCPPLIQGTFINTEWAEDNPDVAKRFVEATLRGVQFFAENPKETQRLFQKRFSDLEDPLINFESTAGTLCGPDSAERGVGYNDREEWQQLIDISVEGEAIEEPLEVDEVMTDEYAPEEPVMASTCE
jgi:ABC-type nitrate/sulfonate/bicarbonate transport system substrate-binding protein